MSTKPAGRKLSGWVAFVGIYLVVAGVLNVLWGVAALSDKRVFEEDSLVWSNLSFWGWTVLVVGVAQLIGAVLVARQRVGGPIIAGFLAFMGLGVNFLSIGAYPIWSAILIAVDALILWAVSVHGEEFV